MRLEDKYEVVKPLGQGAFGLVLLVRDRKTGELSAAKVLTAQDSDARRRFSNEATQLATYGLIKLPHVVRIKEAFLSAEPPFFIMEWVEAGSILPWAGRLLPEQVIVVLKELVETLSLIHLTGGGHRDVKPDNILLLGGSIVLADFGLGNQRTGSAGMTHSAVGTPGYAAPELFQGASSSSASDYYSVGATGFHLLTGQHPKDFSAPLNPITMDPVAWFQSAASKTMPYYATAAGLIRMLTEPRPENRLPAPAAVFLAAKALESDLKRLPTISPPPLTGEQLLVNLLKGVVQANLQR